MIGNPTFLLEKEVLMQRSDRFRATVPLEEEVLRMVDYIRYPNNCQFLSISPPLHPSIPSVSSSIPSLTFYPLVNWIDLLPLHHSPTPLPNMHNRIELLHYPNDCQFFYSINLSPTPSVSSSIPSLISFSRRLDRFASSLSPSYFSTKYS